MADQPSLVPAWSRLTTHVLTALEDGSTLSRSGLRRRASELAQLPPGADQERLSSGQTRLDQRLNWAISHLSKASLIDSPARAQFRITEEGRRWLAAHPHGMDYSEARVYFMPFWPAKGTAALTADGADDAASAEALADPDEVMDAAQERNHADVGQQLLERLRTSDPAFFEQCVLDLLLSMGYGGTEKRGQTLGRSGDGGVDGVIDEDVLGLDRVYIQAKRYAEGNNIPADRIQAFVGALHGQAASKGVFITTSAFTPAATQYVKNLPTAVRLIDGARLVQLMIQYRVGVQRKQEYWTVKIDQDYFE